MATTDLSFATVAELSGLIAGRQLSPVELVQACLARCEQLEPKLNAWITLLPDQALAAARQAEAEIAAGKYRGPLHGIPLAIKDLFYTRGVRTTGASKTLSDFVPDHDAALIERLSAAGAITLGKTNMVELAYGPTNYYQPEFGPTRNPWDLDRFPGGSSTGTGAAIAAGMVPAGLGSDTGGSIRNPASFCGISGLKPTYGLVSAYGAIPLSATLDHMGPLARSAEDCAILLQAMAGFDPRDPASRRSTIPNYRADLGEGVRGLRLGVPRGFFWLDLWPGIEPAVEQAIQTFRELGAQIVELETPGNVPEDSLQAMNVMRAEGSWVHRKAILERPDDFTPEIRDKLQQGMRITAVEFLEAEAARRHARRALIDLFDQADALLTPTRDTTAPRQDASGRCLDQLPHMAAGRAAPTYPWNCAGLPAISVPCGFDPNGLPIGLQVAGRPNDELLVFRVAHAYQQATDWHRRRPTAVERAAIA
jgi:aspartyl-tRNA(Asn)/glutamyl-tRNA(Gln) amidotransferase subunit A